MSLRAPSLLLALVLVALAPGCGGGDTNANPDIGDHFDSGVDGTLPSPGGSLMAENPTSSTVDLSWTAATDDTTAAANLEYRVYFSLTNIDEEGDLLDHGTAASEWAPGLTSLTVESLALETTYFFNVLVRDEAGNVAAYGGASATTLGGTWQDQQPLEDFTGGSVYYSTLTVGPEGDVVVYWDQQPTWDVQFATRSAGATAFSAPVPWSEDGIYTPTLTFGFDGRLMGSSTRDNGDDTTDVLFGSYTEGPGGTFDEVATGLVSEFMRGTSACVAENGDVMVAWMDGTAAGYSVRARVRTGTTWGTTTLLSVTEDRDLYGLDVVCSPAGNHAVLFGSQDGSDRVLNARLYDATLDAWDAAPVPLSGTGYQYNVKTARAADGRVVVAWEEYDDVGMAHSFHARSLTGSTWSTPAATIAEEDVISLGNLRLAAAGDGDVHAVWRAGTEFVTSRLEQGSATWSTGTPLETVTALQEYCVVGDPLGGLLLAWTASNAIAAQRYLPGTDTWETPTPLLAAGESIGYGSLTCILDAQRRGSVVWTVWDPTAMQFSAFERTFR